MNFTLIDMRNWDRKEYFEHYYSSVPCSYSMTINIDITRLLTLIKQYGIKLYPVMIYGISLIVNRHQEFRMSTDKRGNIGFYDIVNPSYTIFHKDEEIFSSVWTEFNTDFQRFYQNYSEDIKQFGNTKKMIAKPIDADNTFNISCIPWSTFTGFNLNLQKGYEYLPPIFTLGKYYTDNSKQLMPISIQVHHAVCDAYHVARFANELQEWINTFVK